MNNCILLLRVGLGDTWKEHKAYATYEEAVLVGQAIQPLGFMVETPGRIPSREEQLLQPITTKTKSKYRQKLDEL